MQNRLRLKATLGTALILGSFLLVLGIYLINSQELQLVQNLRDHGNRIAALTARSSAEYIQRYSFFLMEDQAIAIEQSPQIAFCEIYDAHNIPLLQSGNIISKDHSGKQAARYDKGVMVVSQPIMAGEERLGRVEIGLYLDSIEATIQTKTKHLVVLFLSFTLSVILFLNLFFNRIFITPVMKLAEGTQKLAQQKFVTIDVGRRNDEIGLLARNFNEMSQRLEDLYLNLEGKVSQRTRALEKANKDLLSAIDKAKEMARKAEEGTLAKSQFLASMSHEMRTPMNAVLGMGEILDTSDLDTEQRRYVSILLESGRALLNLIDDILDLSKIEAGEMTFENRPFDLEECVVKSFKVISYAAHQKGLDLEYMIAPDVPTEFTGDPLRLQQILINLLGNGAKFTDMGSVILDISMDFESRETPMLAFCVKDTGIGIQADKLKTIFEKFTQADASTTRRHGGTGLGLSICQLLCEKLDGTIRIESEFGHGCSVFFSLPYQENKNPRPRTSPFSGISFILVDDREYAEKALAARLRQNSAKVDTAATLEEARYALTQAAETGQPYDYALLNIPLAGQRWSKAAVPLIESGMPPEKIILLMPNSITHNKSMLSFGAILNKPTAATDVKTAIVEILARSQSTNTSQEQPNPITSQPRNILLVEDSVANSMLIELYLKDTNHRLTITRNGKEALDVFKNSTFDIVFMDIEMPIMDGFECTRKIRKWEKANDLKQATIVALTAHALSKVRDKILDAGCNSFLTKPIARQNFLQMLDDSE